MKSFIKSFIKFYTESYMFWTAAFNEVLYELDVRLSREHLSTVPRQASSAEGRSLYKVCESVHSLSEQTLRLCTDRHTVPHRSTAFTKIESIIKFAKKKNNKKKFQNLPI